MLRDEVLGPGETAALEWPRGCSACKEQSSGSTGQEGPCPTLMVMTNCDNHAEASGTDLSGQASEAIGDTPERPGEHLEVGEIL